MRKIIITLRCFALLDVLSIILLSRQIYQVISNIKNIPAATTILQIRVILLLGVYILLFVSATGLLLIKKTGLISYYIQFPMRLIVWVFSFGFLTLISQGFNNTLVFDWLFRIAVVLEFFRLYFTVQIHRQVFRGY